MLVLLVLKNNYIVCLLLGVVLCGRLKVKCYAFKLIRVLNALTVYFNDDLYCFPSRLVRILNAVTLQR